MISNLLMAAPDLASEPSIQVKTWLVVSQVKSHRVVYFTDDTDYTPPMDGDWFYVSPYQGELPKGISLRNCWGWRFNGMEFVDAREKKKADPVQALLTSNKEALHKLLREKIDAIRKPLASKSTMGSALRELRLQEARLILSGEADETASTSKLLLNSAAARGISLQSMAERTVAAHETETRLLLESELLRDEIAVAIETATTQQQLMAIRHRLMNELAPELNEQFKIKPAHTTERQLTAKPTPEQLSQEQLRLNVQLRLKINALRRAYVSDYLLDDIVLKHKGHIAQAVLAQGGQVPTHVDATALMSHAAARGQTLVQAAKEVLTEMDETAKVLLDTEQIKEVILSRIAAVASFQDIEAVGKTIHGLVLPIPVTQTSNTVPAPSIQPRPSSGRRDPKALASVREAVLKASKLVGDATGIARVGALDSAGFTALAKSGQPFVLRGIVDQWPLAALKPETLRENFGALQVSARVADYVEAAFSSKREQRKMPLAEYFRLVEQETTGLPPYLGNQSLPELTSLCQWPEYFQSWADPKIWLGPAGTVTPMHCDYDDNLFAQIWGKKRFLLYPPQHAEFLYIREVNPVLFGSRFDPSAPDFDAFPLARRARQIECVVEAGEMLFLPAGWFHHVSAMEFSLSANRWSRDRPLIMSKEAVNQ